MRLLLLATLFLSDGDARRPLRAKLQGRTGLTSRQAESAETALLAATGNLVRNRPRLAAAMLREARARFNDAPGLAPALGAACGLLGDLGCVLEATGSEHAGGALIHLDVRARANALRWHGDGAGAAVVRHQLLLARTLSEQQVGYIWTDIAEDLRVAEDGLGVWHAVAAAESADPDSPQLYALRMELALDQGDVDEALFQAFLAERAGRASLELEEAHMRLSLELDAHEEVLNRDSVQYTYGRLKPLYAVRLLEAQRRAGLHALNLDLIGRNLWLVDGEVWWPQIRAMMALIYLDNGQVADAQRALDRAVEMAPDNDVVRAVVQTCAGRLTPRPFSRPG